MVKKVTFLILFAILAQFHLVWAYDGEVHYKINESAVQSSQLDSILKVQLGVTEGRNTELTKAEETKQIIGWIAYGGEAEDFGWLGKYDIPRTRAYNHFHDPLKEWDAAAFDNAQCLVYTANYFRDPVSAILWGLKHVEQDFLMNLTGDWSWGMAREYYYIYLTGKDFWGDVVAGTQDEREANFADCFRSLGQVMHLLQDMSVPLHTRNDLHVFPIAGAGRWTYETYTKKNKNDLNYSAHPPDPVLLSDPQPDPAYGDILPISGLFDRNQYIGDSIPADNNIIGLAEYSNANFLTNDTMWTYPRPALDDTNYDAAIWLNPETVDAEDGQQDQRIYFRKNTGDPVEHFMVAEYWYYQLHMWNKPELIYALGVDKKCFSDYAAKLIPRAVGYSAGLLDYFFRGEMEIKKAYVRIGSGLTVSGIDFEVKNITPPMDTGQTVEPFESGSLDLSYQYIPDGQGEPVFHLVSEIYTIAGADDPINSEDVPVSVTFPADIPAKAKDLSFTLVFRGKLGNETDAVVGKTLISGNSRIAFCFQPGGDGNEINIYTMLPDGSDIKPITTTSSTNPNDSLYFLSPAWSPDGTMLAFEEETCTDPDATGENGCRAGYFTEDIVVIDLNSDESYPNNVLTTLHLIDTDDVYLYASSPSFSPDGTKIVALANYYGLYGSLIVFDVNTGAWRYILELSSGFRMFPAWSPQGDKIAYNLHEESDIYTINPNGTGNTRLTDDLYLNNYPSWSPDGEWIVFLSDRDGEGYRDIWIMDKTGGNMEKVFDCNPDCYQPSFSPEGLRIVFMQSMEIFTMNFNGSDIPHATPGYLDEAWPAWSPFLPEEP